MDGFVINEARLRERLSHRNFIALSPAKLSIRVARVLCAARSKKGPGSD
jgi:hypothetical protein